MNEKDLIELAAKANGMSVENFVKAIRQLLSARKCRDTFHKMLFSQEVRDKIFCH